MKVKSLFLIFSLSLLVDSLDISTLSNYENIPINYIYGDFKPDFEKKIVYGNLKYNLQANKAGNQIIFDTNKLNIKNIYKIKDPKEENYKEEEVNFSSGKEDENLGTPLIISINYKIDEYIQIRIEFETTTEGSSAQFLTPEQTFGKIHPYFFTQSEMIMGRSLFPCQDTPAVKFQFDLNIIVPKELRGMISGIYRSNETYSEDENYMIYNYVQENDVPSYLVSLAAGNIVEKKITDMISVFSEPEFVEEAYNVLKDDLPKALNLSIEYMGPYLWKQYNVLVLPRSFPFSGMENPSLSFLSPCLIDKDKSLIDIIFHEMIHSWSGNLVTNENWSDFWLNEGITMFLQRKIVGLLRNDTEFARMDGYMGHFYLKQAIEDFGEENKQFTTLRPDLTGLNPDDFFSDVPYEKGYNFIYYIETIIGENTTEKFFKSYFDHFKYKSINYYQFKKYFINFCLTNGVTNEQLNKINWTLWVFTPGDIPIEIQEENKYKAKADEIIEKIEKEEFEGLAEEFQPIPSISKTYILLNFEQSDDFLTENQHKFLTETLKLYEGQNFLISTYYFLLILEKTDKFLENELTSLKTYLSSFGALDYMMGIYEAFYKRDEIEAVETLNSLKTFYHPAMYKNAEEEIQSAKEEFPILALDIKSGKKFYYPYDDIFDLSVPNYKEDLGELILEDNIYLSKGENTEFELNCYLKNKDSQYCILKNNNSSLESSDQYNIKVKERIQKMDYAVKVNESSKFEIKELLDKTKTITKYSYNVAKDSTLKIILNLKEAINFDLPVYFENKKELNLKCQTHETNYECEINKTFCEKYCKAGKEEQKYQVNVLSKLEKSFLDIEVDIKNETEKGGDNNGEETNVLAIVLPCVIGGIFIIAIVIFCIIRSKRRRNLTSEEVSKELISVGLKDSEMREE